MSETNTCPCGQPSKDATICTGCETRLSVALGDIPALADELVTVLARQTKAGGTHVGFITTTPTRPLPYDTKASEVSGALKAILVSWTRLVLDENATAPRMPHDDLAGIGRWLLGQVAWIRLHEAAGDAVSEIHGAVEAVRRVVYRQSPERHYRGPCMQEWAPEPDSAACCLADLYARTVRGGNVTCTQCGQAHSSSDRRDWLIDQAKPYLYTQAELAVLLRDLLEQPIPRSTIASWIRRGRLSEGSHLESFATDGSIKRTPLYRIGDVMDLIAPKRAA